MLINCAPFSKQTAEVYLYVMTTASCNCLTNKAQGGWPQIHGHDGTHRHEYLRSLGYSASNCCKPASASTPGLSRSLPLQLEKAWLRVLPPTRESADAQCKMNQTGAHRYDRPSARTPCPLLRSAPVCVSAAWIAQPRIAQARHVVSTKAYHMCHQCLCLAWSGASQGVVVHAASAWLRSVWLHEQELTGHVMCWCARP